MKDNIEIQQEFENLVAQLEKLRKINEMTSINEESACISVPVTFSETKEISVNEVRFSPASLKYLINW